jgi:glucosyl-3-phosphoglycerate synthase
MDVAEITTYRPEDVPGDLFDSDKRGEEPITLCIPAQDEATTIGHIVSTAVGLQARGCLDHVVVVADRCTDDTARIAEDAGATVLDTAYLFPELGPCLGKGDVLWRALPQLADGIVAFIDGDSGTEVDERFILTLIAPLLLEQETLLVKGVYDKLLLCDDGTKETRREGRVSALVAKPALSLAYPALLALEQPLSGEMAARTGLWKSLDFPADYGVEVSTLIQLWETYGRLDVFAQADLGTRCNGANTIKKLQSMAAQVIGTVMLHATGEQLSATRVVRDRHSRS